MKMKIGADLSDANIVFLQYPRLPCARITWTGKNKSAHAGAFVFSPEMKRSVTQDNSGENRFIPSPWKGHQTNASQARIQKRNRARARAHTHTRTHTHTHIHTPTHAHTPNPLNYVMDYGISNVRTDVNACDCTRGCTDTLKETTLKVDSGRKIPCRTGESNLRQRRDGPML